MSESALWRWLKQAKLTLPDLHMERVENAVGAGLPDVIGCYNGQPFFVELNCVPRLPKRASTPIDPKVRGSQWEWHMNWSGANGESFFLVQLGESRCLIPYRGMHHSKLTLAEWLDRSVLPPTCKQAEVVRYMAKCGSSTTRTP